MGLADRDYYRKHHSSKSNNGDGKYSYVFKTKKSTKSSNKSKNRYESSKSGYSHTYNTKSSATSFPKFSKPRKLLNKIKIKLKILFSRKNLLIAFLIASAFFIGSNQSYIEDFDFYPIVHNMSDDVQGDDTKDEPLMNEDETDNGIDIKKLNILGADGYPIILRNYDNATDPTYEELKQFLLKDDTEDHEYNPDSFVCADFAEMLHNRSEKAGINAGYVSVDFSEVYSNTTEDGHALVVYDTTDKGLVFVDATNTIDNRGQSYDRIAYLVKDKEYGTIPIKKVRYEDGFEYEYYSKYQRNKYNFRYDPLGIVSNYNIYW